MKLTAAELTELHNKAIQNGAMVEVYRFEPHSGLYVCRYLEKLGDNVPLEYYYPPETYHHTDNSCTYFYISETSLMSFLFKCFTKNRKAVLLPKIDNYFRIRVWYN